jgi:cobalamin biosynthetic protein CobC
MRLAVAHGGALNAAMRAFPDAPGPWLDLSTGINPVPWPLETVPTQVWTRLPEADAITGLEAAAARAYGAPYATCVVAAPGTQSLIQWLPRLFPAHDVAILGPTYAEHDVSWRASSARVRIVPTLAHATDCDTVVVVNPNNPDGRLAPVAALLAAAGRCDTQGGRLVVDEAFMDVIASSASLVPHVATPSVIVLRSFGKMYGLAGLRLGFAIAAPETAAQIRAALGPWPVSGPAIAIATRALSDEGWRLDATRRLERDALRLDAMLLRAGFRMAGGTPLFRLAMREDARDVHVALCRRFGLPGVEADWTRLERALARLRETALP